MFVSTKLIALFAITSMAIVIPQTGTGSDNASEPRVVSAATTNDPLVLVRAPPNNTSSIPPNAPSSGANDFGSCKPTMDFKLGRGNRKATEGTFLPSDPIVAKGQQDALNPNIITNRICDQLTNVCNASAAAKARCQAAKAKIKESGKKDASVADTWNAELGFGNN